MDKEKLGRAIDMVYELEGLMMLASGKNFEDESYRHLCSLISAKAGNIADMVYFEEASEATIPETIEALVDEPKEHEQEASVEHKSETPVPSPFEFDEEETPDAEPAIEEEEMEAEALEEEEPDAEPAIEEEKMEREAILNLDRKIRFSLNDKFRYRRELFNGSEDRFNNAVAMISSFDGIEDVEDYIYNELKLDPDNEVVAEFMNFIEKYF